MALQILKYCLRRTNLGKYSFALLEICAQIVHKHYFIASISSLFSMYRWKPTMDNSTVTSNIATIYPIKDKHFVFRVSRRNTMILIHKVANWKEFIFHNKNKGKEDFSSDQYSLKVLMKAKERMRNCLRWEDTKETQQLNAV